MTYTLAERNRYAADCRSLNDEESRLPRALERELLKMRIEMEREGYPLGDYPRYGNRL